MKQILQPGFEIQAAMAQKDRKPLLRIGRVTKVNAAQNTVDLAFMDGSGVCLNATVLSSITNTSGGLSYLPDPYVKDDKDNLPVGTDKRDLYAVVAYIHGLDALPVVLGFKTPDFHQLSFENKAGFENHYIDRHAGDRYHRIVGDTVAEMGGTDAPTEEELYWPDGSYFKVYHATPVLTTLTGENADDDVQPFRLKKETAKGFYFQHVSGAIFKIDPSGDIQIKHPSGSWFSIAAATTGATAQTVPNTAINSANNPPAAGSTTAVQIHIEHSSGTTINVDATGNITISGAGTTDIESTGAITVESGASLTLTDGGGASVAMDGAGGVSVSGASSATITASGSIALNAPSVTKNGAEIKTV